MDLARVVLREVHHRIPVAVKAVVGQGRLHLLRVEEVEVCSIELSFERFNFSLLLLQLLLISCRLLIISHYQLVEIRLFLLLFHLVFSGSTILVSRLVFSFNFHLGLFPLLLLLNPMVCDPVELYFANDSLETKGNDQIN